MGIRTYGPHVIAFLEWVHQQQPDARAFNDLEPHVLEQLKRRFFGQLPAAFNRRRPNVQELVRYGFGRDEAGCFMYQRGRSLPLLRPNAAGGFDALSLYLRAPFRSIFLYTELDHNFRKWLSESWRAIDREAGTLLHFFDYHGQHYIGFEGRRNSEVVLVSCTVFRPC